jgi:proteasome lid subunit RPN8/RPN11
MAIDLRISEKDWLKLQRFLSSSFRSGRQQHETGLIGLLGECEGNRHELIINELFLPGPEDFKIVDSGALVFNASFIRQAHLKMRSEGLAGIAIFHTHPFSDDYVRFSAFDLQQDPLLI